MAYRPLTKPTASSNKPSGTTGGLLSGASSGSSKTALRAKAAMLLSQASFHTFGKSHWDAIKQSGLLPEDTLEALKRAQQKEVATLSASEQLLSQCALRFHFHMSEDIKAAAFEMEQAVLELTGADACEIFTFDELTGVYKSIHPKKRSTASEKNGELTVVSDESLKQWLGVGNQPKAHTAHQYLALEQDLLGLVAIRYANTTDTAISINAPVALEALLPFLTLKLLHFMQIRRGLYMPHQQQVLTELSNRLVSAVDKESIITETLDVLWSHLGFGACQYVVLNSSLVEDASSSTTLPESASLLADGKHQSIRQQNEGMVLYENINGRLSSFFHAGLISKRHVVKDFASIVSLLSSGWRKHNYLHLSGGQLGDKSLSSIFGVRQVHSTLVLPIVDVQTGKINATLNVFQTKPIEISNETIDLLMTVMELVANALGRATVLEKALAMATRDELTGLLNRRGFYERFQAELDRARRHPTQLCVALIDVDHFKKLNDSYGHLSGDKVLFELGNALSRSLRRTDIVSRFGGEEFAILLPDVSLAQATDLLERMGRGIAKMSLVGANGEALKITVSMGVATVGDLLGELSADTEIDSDLSAPISDPVQKIISQSLANADAALYDAKAKGRNRVCQAKTT
ncbi:MAG: GGDEF domain-containing protein [Vampirovibrionales bacterium]|nr:GGDEF domain-containing protein [Vampirovibrionales bacterium]